jgi:hypothetical protein
LLSVGLLAEMVAFHQHQDEDSYSIADQTH